MRSFIAALASETKRSGGIQGRSRWQSAEILRYCIIAPCLEREASVQSEIDDVTRMGVGLAALDPAHDVGERRVGARIDADLRALGDDEAVEELDLGPPALQHILAHGWPLLRRDRLVAGEQPLLDRHQRRDVALARARDQARLQMEDLL